jgi:tRNA U34 5-methylaminomethyl-2-thiouridine-forming methyltransferase MnmC
MDSFTDCMNALRALSADASLDPASRFLAAARVIRHYLEQAGSNIRKRESMLSKLNSETAAMEQVDDFWSMVRDIIAQLRNP